MIRGQMIDTGSMTLNLRLKNIYLYNVLQERSLSSTWKLRLENKNSPSNKCLNITLHCTAIYRSEILIILMLHDLSSYDKLFSILRVLASLYVAIFTLFCFSTKLTIPPTCPNSQKKKYIGLCSICHNQKTQKFWSLSLVLFQSIRICFKFSSNVIRL